MQSIKWQIRNYDDALKAVRQVDGVCTPQHLKEIDAHWHLSCYKKFTHKRTLSIQEKRFHQTKEEHIDDDSVGQKDCSTSAVGSSYVTRASVPEYSKSKCFFCDTEGNVGDQLRHVSDDSAGDSLRRAVELSNNAVYRVRLSETITPGDAHAMDVLYHKTCWSRNVRNVLRKNHKSTSGSVYANSLALHRN